MTEKVRSDLEWAADPTPPAVGMQTMTETVGIVMHAKKMAPDIKLIRNLESVCAQGVRAEHGNRSGACTLVAAADDATLEGVVNSTQKICWL